MATSLQLYKKSTFPPLLNMYQPLHCRNQNGKPPSKKNKDDNRKKRNNKSSFSDEDKEDAMKRAMLEQRHLENYKNLYRLRNAMYVRYRDLLNKKVQKQRIQIQMSDLNFKQNLEQRGRRKCILGHQVPYCKLSHDAKYLESIPQSSNYLIIGMQNELTRLGILKNQQDYEDFWTLILEGTHGSRLKEKLQDIKSKMTAAKSFPSHPVVRTSAAQSADALLANRRGQLKTRPASLPGLMSRQPPTHHSSKHTKAQEETEQIFPKPLLSWLAEFQKRPEEQSRTQEVSKPCRKTRKHFHPERHMIYLHHMYHLALLNMTSSLRLLEKNGQFAVAEKEHSVRDLYPSQFISDRSVIDMWICALACHLTKPPHNLLQLIISGAVQEKNGQFAVAEKEHSVRDLMEYLFPSHHKQPGNSSTERGTEESTFPILLDGNQQERCHRGFFKTQTVFKEMKNNSKKKRHENKGAIEFLNSQKYNTKAFAPHEMNTVPLTMEDVVLNNPVVEAKSAITYWTNYLDKEESIF